MHLENKSNSIKEVNNMCDANYKYYTENLSSFLEKYPNKFVVIKNCSIIGIYDNFRDAYNDTIKTNELGSFLIQHCAANENNINCFYSNNVVFG